MDSENTEASLLSEEERATALSRFQLLRPFLEDEVPLASIAKDKRLNLRTLRRWVRRYRKMGLAGLSRKARRDKNKRRMSPELEKAIEGLALQKPRTSAATIYRKVVGVAKRLGEAPPSYRTVHLLIQKLNPALVTLAHQGAKRYSETFDLIHRTESKDSNAIWQVDHSQLDIWLIGDDGKPRKPWLTVVLDDFSRAVAGFMLFFGAPSAIQTALALRQAIWRKERPGWHICGIPEVLYTDHGSDFTSKHIEAVAAELKISLVYSAPGKPRGRGKIERFFETLTQVFLPRLPGFCPPGSDVKKGKLRLSDLASELEAFLVDEYHLTTHSTTKEAPQARWNRGGFLPRMPLSLEQLDLLLLTVPKERRVHQDGVRFMGLRYLDPTLAAYVGERVILRYDPRDMAEVRLYFEDRFLCRAVCQELAGATVALREIVQARDQRRRELKQTLEERRRTVDSLLEARRWAPSREEEPNAKPRKAPKAPKLKRYFND